MALALFKKVCVDAVDPLAMSAFWADVLDLRQVPDATGEAGLVDADGRDRLWFNQVPQPKTVKHRVHLDVYVEDTDAVVARGASLVLREGADRRWTVLADPEGGEFCAFRRTAPPEHRLHGLVVDTADPTAQAHWWGTALDGEVVHHQRGYSTVQGLAELPNVTMDFVPVPERKAAPNRVHWDLASPSVAPLLEIGATLLRAAGGDIEWDVLADPEGNEFCVFPTG